ncbi:MAG: YoaK family protein, partial [Blautia sp.]|nr:YoaK family protein [Blautia sp.]
MMEKEQYKIQLPQKQMSEAFINSVFLALSGGFQDAYTYNTRDGVFSNAQTGNVVLMSQHFMT